MKYLAPLLLIGAAPYGGPCVFIGDEIAQSIAVYKPECAVVTRPGSTTATLQRITLKNSYGRVYISVGTNGYLNPQIGPNLFAIRKRVKTMPVTWIAPRNKRAEQAVFETAVHFHDNIVYLNKVRPTKALRATDFKKIAKQL